MQQLVVTAVGPDRPGLVDEFSGYLLDAGANLADSRMVNLLGRFALIMLAEAPDDPTAKAIEASAAALEDKTGLHVTVWRDDDAGTPVQPGVTFRLRTSAMDQPGIVHRITHLLHQHNVNIEELQTRLEPGSYAGTPRFAMEMCMTIPADLPVETLRDQLEQLCNSLNCDLDLHPAT